MGSINRPSGLEGSLWLTVLETAWVHGRSVGQDPDET